MASLAPISPASGQPRRWPEGHDAPTGASRPHAAGPVPEHLGGAGPIPRLVRLANDRTSPQPLRLPGPTMRALKGLVRAVLPPEPIAERQDVVDDVAEGVCRMLRVLPKPAAFGFVMGMHAADLAPMLRLRAAKPLADLDPEAGAQHLTDLAHCGLMPVETLMMGIRAMVLSQYYDLPVVHDTLGYAPREFMTERVLRRRDLMAGATPAEETTR